MLNLVGVLPDLPGPWPHSPETALRSWSALSRATRLACGKVMAVPWAGDTVGGLCFFMWLAHEVDIQGRKDPFPACSACGKETYVGFLSQPLSLPGITSDPGLLYFSIL